MLNPDGVQRGHYRTDSRGVNLNRMYLDPNFQLYPSIYASKALLVYHHVQNRKKAKKVEEQTESPRAKSEGSVSEKSRNQSASRVKSVSIKPGERVRSSSRTYNLVYENGVSSTTILETAQRDQVHLMEELRTLELEDDLESTVGNVEDPLSESFDLQSEGDNVNTVEHQYICADTEESEQQNMIDDDVAMDDDRDGRVSPGHIGNEGSDEEVGGTVEPPPGVNGIIHTPHLADPKLLQIPPSESGIAFYVDLHGHASKRGCFIYGNYYENEDTQVENMLFPKLISMNTAHFDFTGCNFTERNMYMKDKRDGLSKEGSGRVAIFKALGIIHRYVVFTF